MKVLIGLLIIGCATALAQVSATKSDNPVPAYHSTPPGRGALVAPILTPQQLAGGGFTAPSQTESYKAAARVPGVLYQMPCYCFCDRAHGHTSLRSCFESTHGANCSTCMAEALYAYRMSKKGWTARMIRDGIVRGDWKLIDLQHPAPVM
jgi:Protein of unknown function with PCYCGC motif